MLSVFSAFSWRLLFLFLAFNDVYRGTKKKKNGDLEPCAAKSTFNVGSSALVMYIGISQETKMNPVVGPT